MVFSIIRYYGLFIPNFHYIYIMIEFIMFYDYGITLINLSYYYNLFMIYRNWESLWNVIHVSVKFKTY